VATINLNDSLPAAPSGTTNCKWQADAPGTDPRNISVYMPILVGDSGSGGSSGAVPAPSPGDAAANKFLKASGAFATLPAVNLTSEVIGILPIANGGSGTSTPSLVAGANITISGAWPNQTITAAGASLPTEVRETPSGTMNGSNTNFTLSYTPSPSASLTLWLNGVEQVPGIDYTISSATITYTIAPKSTDLHVAQYSH
jgi:hypothetical protein